MTNQLEKQFANIKLPLETLNPQDIYKLVDLTLLDKNATTRQIIETFNKAIEKKMAAICLYPEAFTYLLGKTNIKKATVVNFPTGNIETKQVINDITNAINYYLVDEIDYVFPYQQYLNNNKIKSLNSCHAILDICQKHNKTLKVIIESGAFTSSSEIYDLSVQLANIGCHFIKTSTGKIKNGASLEAAFAILMAIKDTKTESGIKISGGIRTFQQANEYIKLAEYVLEKQASSKWFRIGTSLVF